MEVAAAVIGSIAMRRMLEHTNACRKGCALVVGQAPRLCDEGAWLAASLGLTPALSMTTGKDPSSP